MVDDLLALCRERAPDLLVFDPYLFAAPLVAAASGARPVLHSIGPLMDRNVLDLVADAVSPIWREFGSDVPLAAGIYSGTTLTVCPPSLEPAAAGLDRAQPLRPAPLPLAEPAALPVSFSNPENPLVYLTLGTFSNNDLDLFGLVLGALEDEPVNVLATIGRDNDPSALAPTPDNARVEQYIAQTEVLPYCSAVVHHAGSGTMFGVLAHGLAFGDTPSECRQLRQRRPAGEGWRRSDPDARAGDWRRRTGRCPHGARFGQLPSPGRPARRRDRGDALGR